MTESLQLVVAYRQIPKRGLSAEQCEDAWAANPAAGRFAVADGATDSYASGRFARLLVDGFVDGLGPASAEDIAEWARASADAWAEATPTDGLPWYKQEKARLGAHCTFLGVQLEVPGAADMSGSPVQPDRQTVDDPLSPSRLASGSHPSPLPKGEGTWPSASTAPLAYRAFAVGDVCLFRVRDDRLIEVMPVARPEDFGVQPALVATSRTYPGPGLEALVESTGELEPGDRLYLASDAVARWMLVSAGEGKQPWSALDEAGAEEFTALVERLRDEGQMRNDDVTVVAITVEAPPEDAPDEPPPTAGEEEALQRHSPSARRQIERAAAVSLAVGALGVGIALVCGPKTGQAAADSLKDLP